MRFYKKRFAKKFADEQVKSRTETRDAILWDFDEDTFTCRVKIQGSGSYVTAHYPRNWKKIPYWLKPGCSVRILHRSGVKGYIEVTGEGRAIPTPIDGQVFPTDLIASVDKILTGMEMTQTDPASMTVSISSGTYRIDGAIYSPNEELFSEGIPVMDDPAPMILGDVNPSTGTFYVMGFGGGVFYLDAAPSGGYHRYDAFAICADGEITYVKGTAALNDPVKPDIPDGCLIVGTYIFVKSGVQEITNDDIGAEFETRVPSQLTVTSDYGKDDQGMYYWPGSGPIPVNDIRVTVKDQYDIEIKNGNDGWPLSATLLHGTGVISPSGSITANPYVDIDYSRLQQVSPGDDPEVGPIQILFQCTDSRYPLVYYLEFDIWDDGGDPIIGEWSAF